MKNIASEQKLDNQLHNKSVEKMRKEILDSG